MRAWIMLEKAYQSILHKTFPYILSSLLIVIYRCMWWLCSCYKHKIRGNERWNVENVEIFPPYRVRICHLRTSCIKILTSWIQVMTRCIAPTVINLIWSSVTCNYCNIQISRRIYRNQSVEISRNRLYCCKFVRFPKIFKRSSIKISNYNFFFTVLSIKIYECFQVFRDAVHKHIKGTLLRKPAMARLYLYPEEVCT